MTSVVFFGTPELSVPFLQALLEDGAFDVLGVVTRPDRPSGRGLKRTSNPVAEFAEEHGLTLFKEAPAADLYVSVAYGRIIKAEVLSRARLGCINVHPSLLPEYRGPSPLTWAIMEGKKETGITIMLMDAGMDTGPILAQEKMMLAQGETLTTLTHQVMRIGPALLVSATKGFLAGTVKPQAQDDAKATVTKLLEKEDGRVDWSMRAAMIEQRVRAFDPWPSAWTTWQDSQNKKRFVIRQARVVSSLAQPPPAQGTLFEQNGQLFVACGDGWLELLILQI